MVCCTWDLELWKISLPWVPPTSHSTDHHSSRESDNHERAILLASLICMQLQSSQRPVTLCNTKIIHYQWGTIHILIWCPKTQMFTLKSASSTNDNQQPPDSAQSNFDGSLCGPSGVSTEIPCPVAFYKARSSTAELKLLLRQPIAQMQFHHIPLTWRCSSF